jgi:hypothetical protein
MKIPNLTVIYLWFGGFAETITVVALVAAIVLAAFNHLTDAFAATITAIGGSAIAHDQLTQWNNRRDRDDHDTDTTTSSTVTKTTDTSTSKPLA